MEEGRLNVQDDASQRQAQTTREQTQANERNSVRQARTAATAAAGQKRSDRAAQSEKKE